MYVLFLNNKSIIELDRILFYPIFTNEIKIMTSK